MSNNHLLGFMKGKIDQIFQAIDRSAQIRAKQNEQSKYDKRPLIIFMAILCATAIILLIRGLTPPGSIVNDIKNNPDKYYTVSSGKVWFGKTKDNVYNITLPDRQLDRFSDYSRESIHYEFSFSIPDKYFQKGQTALLFPKVWGHSTVTINNRVANFGKNTRQVYPLTEKFNKLFISVHAKSSWKAGVRGTYPLVIGNIDNLRKLTARIDRQVESLFRAIVAQLSITIIVLMLFLSFPRKPELLAFVVLFFTTSLHSAMVIYFAEWAETLSSTYSVNYKLLTSIVRVLRNLCLFWFVLEFFRFGRSVKQKIWSAYGLGALFVFIFSVFYPLSESSGYTWYFMNELLFEFLTLGFSTVLGLTTVAYLYFYLGHTARALFGLVILSSVIFVLAKNAYGVFWFAQHPTPVYLGNFYTYFAVVLVTVFEFSRTEKKNSELAKILPKEARNFANNPVFKERAFHKGYVVLIDAIGFTKFQDRLPPNKQKSLTEHLLIEMLSYFPNASLLSMTGDGFYFAWEEDESEKALHEKLIMISNLLLGRHSQRIKSDNSLPTNFEFRAAIKHGAYSVGIISHGHLASAYSTGSTLSELERIIGNGQTQSLRIGEGTRLSMWTIKKTINGSIQTTHDKHGKKHRFLSVSMEAISSLSLTNNAA